jgi:hypothetical protein
MEKNINLAKILNGKPVNTKLWSPLFGDVYTSSICSEDTIIVVNHHAESSSFYNNGKYFNHAEAELLLFPSKEMRDWSKFAWKKGDVLVSNDGGTEVIFDKWYDDTYTNFYSKHYLNSEDENNIKYNEAFLCTTERYSLEDKDTAQTYINTIEKRLGGKLNLDTLEIEKTQPEFKDGDIVCISGMGYLTYGIVKSIDNSSKKLEYYVLNDMSTLNFEDWLSFEDKHIQPITETQQIILFDALEKEGKAWDAEKQIVDIKKEHQFKPFEKVLVRDSIDDVWRASFFSHIKENDGRYVTTCVTWKFCIPYIGNESLLGTTKDVEG